MGRVYELLHYRSGCVCTDRSLSKSTRSLWLNVEPVCSRSKTHTVGAGGRRRRVKVEGLHETTCGGGEELGAQLNEFTMAEIRACKSES